MPCVGQEHFKCLLKTSAHKCSSVYSESSFEPFPVFRLKISKILIAVFGRGDSSVEIEIESP